MARPTPGRGIAVIAGVVAAAAGLRAPADPPAARVDFNRDVLPILSARCFACHGPDASQRKAGLRLDARADALAERDDDPAITPGRPDKSALITRVSHAKAGRMPPPKAGPALTHEQVEVLTRWIEQGAEYADHWAFVAPKRPPLPRVADGAWPQTPVDAFVLQALEARGLKHAPKASREVLIRRATLDLTGLPPTPAEVKAFLADTAPDAYERLIERLLASPHYGERWGRHWLDVVRYADSGGFETDIFYSHAWRYRDYVIRAFNADKPFDRFLKEQIAGDELYPGDAEALLATSVFTIGPVLEESAMVKGWLEYDLLTDMVDTTGSAFLGLTLGCARCHDHKYDPVSQKDYYALQGLFAASDLYDIKPDGSRTNQGGKLPIKSTLAVFELEQAKARARRLSDAEGRSRYLKQVAEYYAGKGAGRPEDGMMHLGEPSLIPVRVLAHRPKPLEIRLLKRGELDTPGAVVAPGLPETLAGATARKDIPAKERRAALAEWIASKDNPLTARVIVNRVWQWHFGQGLVRTPNDFGVRGERPTHPELLDWLTVEFVKHGWSLKHLHRVILRSAAYQMASAVDPAILEADPDNRWVTRFQPRRVEAEVIWDLQRAAAGTLDLTMFDLPFAPPLDAQEQIGNFRRWPASLPEEANRRALYILVKRSFRFPMFSAFDLPDNVNSCGQRDSTVVPNQALTLLNNKLVHEQARAFAKRLLAETDGTPAAVAELAWWYAYGRPIAAHERQKVTAFLAARRRAHGGEGAELRAAQELCLALFNTNEFIYLP
jgi:mono/diheme cytochrome c family protein